MRDDEDECGAGNEIGNPFHDFGFLRFLGSVMLGWPPEVNLEHTRLAVLDKDIDRAK